MYRVSDGLLIGPTYRIEQLSASIRTNFGSCRIHFEF